jgi:hypothetical protein
MIVIKNILIMISGVLNHLNLILYSRHVYLGEYIPWALVPWTLDDG